MTARPRHRRSGRAGTRDAGARAAPALQRLWRPADQPGWARPALVGLLSRPLVLYLWGLGASGWANAFYSAAAQAGSESWKAFFFGSSDAVELHHRRQDPGLAVGDGAVGADLRAQLVEHPGARRR